MYPSHPVGSSPVTFSHSTPGFPRRPLNEGAQAGEQDITLVPIQAYRHEDLRVVTQTSSQRSLPRIPSPVIAAPPVAAWSVPAWETPLPAPATARTAHRTGGVVGWWNGLSTKTKIIGSVVSGAALLAIIVGASVGAASGHGTSNGGGSGGGSTDGTSGGGSTSGSGSTSGGGSTPSGGGGGGTPLTTLDSLDSQMYAEVYGGNNPNPSRKRWTDIIPISSAVCGSNYNAAQGGCTMGQAMRGNLQVVNAPTFYASNEPTAQDALYIQTMCNEGGAQALSAAWTPPNSEWGGAPLQVTHAWNVVPPADCSEYAVNLKVVEMGISPFFLAGADSNAIYPGPVDANGNVNSALLTYESTDSNSAFYFTIQLNDIA